MGVSQPRRIYPTPTSLPRDRKSAPLTLPPPVGGWNTRDDPVSMGATDAIELINIYPTQDKVAVRKGFQSQSNVNANSGIQTDTTNYLDGGDIAAFDFGASQDFSVEFWTQHNGGSDVSTSTILGKKVFGGAGWEVGVNETSENIIFQIDDGVTGQTKSFTDALPNDGIRRHIAITVDRTADEVRGYVNSVEVTGSPFDISGITGSLDSGTSAFRVFDNVNTSGHFDNGFIDDIRIWNDVRTATEIADNYQAEVTPDASLIGYWTCNGSIGASVATVTDSSSGSNDLTDTGAGDSTYVLANTFEETKNIDTVAEFFAGSTRKLIAATDDDIFDASTTPATSLSGSFSNGQWQTAMMNGVMGLVNGADAPQDYDGTTLGAMTVSGPTVAELIGIFVFKGRSYFWKADSPSFWYSALNALGGVLTEFALGEISERGGNLLAMTSWTVDGGSGPDDYAVFIMDSGEVLVYQGDDPGTSADWAIVGRYTIPTPMGRRAVAKVGGEIAVLTDQDIVFLPSAFSSPSPPESKLAGAIKVSAAAYRTNFGWDVKVYKDRLIINIPASASSQEQYVINLNTGAPARFNGMNARSWTVYDDGLYFGGTDGVVYQADTNTSDNGDNINADAKQAWVDLGVPSNKKVEAIRTVWSALADIGATVAYDYVNENPSREVTTGGTGTPWGSAWGSAWSSTLEIRDSWQLEAGYGQVMSVQVSVGVNGNTPEWYRTDIRATQAPNI